MKDGYIASPRPFWEDPKLNKSDRIATLGSDTGGVMLVITKKGIAINGYYAGIKDASKYANMREFLTISWEDLERMKQEAERGKPREKELPVLSPDKIDDPPKEYLESLPQVSLNGIKFYVDMERQERRPVSNPRHVFDFKKQASREPN